MTATTSHEPFVFTPSAASTPGASGDNPVDQARQEITAILREVASATTVPRHRDEYLRFFADRLLRAMAAHGVIIWRWDEPKQTFVAHHRLGSITDTSLEPPQARVHEALVTEVAVGGEPVVIPSTPGADQVDASANPLTHPIGLVPVSIDPTAAIPQWTIEAVLEPGGTPASQRGSLRFMAQMADLAGEYLRYDHSRDQQQRLAWIQWIDDRVSDWSTNRSSVEIETLWVDAIADLLGESSPQVTRISLCHVSGQRTRLASVAHVDQVDRRGNAARHIVDAASGSLSDGDSPVWRVVEVNQTDQPEIPPRLVWATDRKTPWRVVCSGDESLTDTAGNQWLHSSMADATCRLMRDGETAWLAARRIERLPAARWWLRWQDEGGGAQSKMQPAAPSRIRSWAKRIVVAGLVLGAACCPVARNVPAVGVLRPAELDGYHTPVDAVVVDIAVDHGQSVARGDVLARLESRDLQQRWTTLIGRRSVLVQRLQAWKQSLVRSKRDPSMNASISEGAEIDDEIQSIDNQLAILESTMDDLSLTARRDGTVDAWRVREQLVDRPLSAGTRILNVIPKDADWVVDTQIPQHRLRSVVAAMDDHTLATRIQTDWQTSPTIQDREGEFGPTQRDPVDGTPVATLRMRVEPPAATTQHRITESPADVTLRCGYTPLGWYLLEDVISGMTRIWNRYR
ncbi:MAG: biotin/lipoyl-binding protein [Planctomycetota bacterium]